MGLVVTLSGLILRKLKAAISTRPPTGFVTTPTRPLPRPLMSPAAPFRLAPEVYVNITYCMRRTQQTTEPLTGCRTIPVTPS